MTPISPVTAQWMINVLLALGQGHDVPFKDIEKLGEVLCPMVKDPEGERFSITVGKAKLWCNNAPPQLPAK